MNAKRTPEEWKALWQKIQKSGGSRRYVEGILKQKGVWVRRISPEDFLHLSAKEKKAYIQRLQREEKIRKPLQEEAWKAYTQAHIVHLGHQIYWYDQIDIDRFDPDQRLKRIKDYGLPVLETVDQLCRALKIDIPTLRWFAYHREASTISHYRRFEIPKKTGGKRAIWAPKPRLKAIQKWIQEEIVDRLPVHGAAHGFILGKSIYTNAAEHVGAQRLVTMDLADFFPSLTFPRVKGIFRKAGYLEGIATILALLVTEAPRELVQIRGQSYYVALGPRALPQGSPASPGLTNLACRRLDQRLMGLSEKWGWHYTRYADDMTFSWHHASKPKIKALIRAVTQIVRSEGFKVRKDKTHVLGGHQRQSVTGLVVNQSEKNIPRTPREVKRLLRASLHRLQKGQGIPSGGKDLNALKGLAAFVHMSEPKEGKKFLNALKKYEGQF